MRVTWFIYKYSLLFGYRIMNPVLIAMGLQIPWNGHGGEDRGYFVISTEIGVFLILTGNVQ